MRGGARQLAFDDAGVMVDVIDNAERRRRLAMRHHLFGRSVDAVEVAGDLVGFHSSDPASVFLSARARVEDLSVRGLEHDLYEARRLIRMHGERRTMFVVPSEMARLIEGAAAHGYLTSQINRIARLAEADGVADDGVGWVRGLMDATTEALEGRGPTPASELSAIVPGLATKLAIGRGTTGMTSRTLYLLGLAESVVRGRPRGSWLASQYPWSRTEDWFGGRWESLDPESARAERLALWLTAYGPGTMVDMQWWTGWSKTKVQLALTTIGGVEVGLEKGTGFVAPGDTDATPDPGRWAAFLPSLDPTPMGWKERGWFGAAFPGPHYDRNGNIGPTVWCDGRVVGAWATGERGDVRVRIDEPGADRDLIETERVSLESWLGGTKISPRFRTPIERELSG